ncbi:Putative transposase of IS4/5 family [Actinopolyspora xinjiangensis]|uniref:Putative transposase of IS4/5 family n=1 Tax=Actinopolyspora xinjiangensis TaxID=405564 RepID=A0A1H0X1Q3_9ACTN|nr:Putative transposase of IS4/5 family [Actinopolyspora xinjiangensis]
MLEPLMLANPVHGHQWNDHRRTINGTLWRVRTGTPWRDLPKRYGNWKSVYDRHRRWSVDGMWDRIAEALRIDADTGEALDVPTIGVDSSSVRAHQHAAGARHEPPAESDQNGGWLTRTDRDGREALGRSRGGLTTTIHVAADLRYRPPRDDHEPGPAGRFGHVHHGGAWDPFSDIRARADPGLDPGGSWPIRPTPAAPSASNRAGVASSPSSANTGTSEPTAPARARPEDAHRPSTVKPTDSATPPNAASTNSNNTAP